MSGFARRRRSRAAVIAVAAVMPAAALTTNLVAAAPPASAVAATCAGPLPSFTPDPTLPAGITPIFNSEPYPTAPAGYTPNQAAISTQLVALVNATAPSQPDRFGLSGIYMAAFNLDDCTLANALVAAAQRLVNVDLVLDYATTGGPGYQTVLLQSQQPNSTLHLTVCGSQAQPPAEQGCLSHSTKGVMHNKLAVFSTIQTDATGDAKTAVSFITSQNANDSAVDRGSGNAKWNNAILDVPAATDRNPVYRSYARYVETLLLRGNTTTSNYNDYGDQNCSATDSNGGFCQTRHERLDRAQHLETDFYPVSPGSDDTDINLLDTTGCRSGGTLDVVEDKWTGKRGLDLLAELKTLAQAGCHVNVMARLGPGTLEAAPDKHNIYGALKRDVAGRFTASYMCGPETYNKSADASPYTRNHSFHSKYWTYLHSTHSEVYTGSENWTGVSLTDSDQSQLRIKHNLAIAKAYAANFASLIRARDGVITSTSPGQGRLACPNHD